MKKITVDNISKYYNKKEILSNISFSVSEGECLGIMGESGSGKSTLVKLIVGLESYDKGDISFNGIFYRNSEKKEMKNIHKKIQLVFQNTVGVVNPKFSVEEVLTEPLYVHYKKIMSCGERKRKAINILEKVGLSSEYLSYPAVHLSGGQLQRVCIARALILEPEIIIFDESLSGLDPIIQVQILDLLSELKEKLNLTYILISHDFGNCYYLCDRVLIMNKGKIEDIIENLDFPFPIKNEYIEKIVGKYKKIGYFK